jgi:hypothetical protein
MAHRVPMGILEKREILEIKDRREIKATVGIKGTLAPKVLV